MTRIAIALATFLCLSACTPYVYVDSRPRGAEILVNGAALGQVTPTEVRLPDLQRVGANAPFKIEVQAKGYRKPPGQFTSPRVSTRQIVAAILVPPFLIFNGLRGFKTMSPNRLVFHLPPSSE